LNQKTAQEPEGEVDERTHWRLMLSRLS